MIFSDVDPSEYEYISEAVDPNGHKKKWKVRGNLIQAKKVNRNGRSYPRPLVEREVLNYNKDFIVPGFSHGCLGHPPSPITDESKISHYISELRMEGDYGVGELVLMDTACGLIAQQIFAEGKRLCVSTRGTGSLGRDGTVNDDWNLIAIDLVHVPSGQDCTVNAILESKAWIVKTNPDNIKVYEQFEASLAKNGSRELKRDLMRFFEAIN